MIKRFRLLRWLGLLMYVALNCLVSNAFIAGAEGVLLVFVVIGGSVLSFFVYSVHWILNRKGWTGDLGAWRVYGIGLLILSPIFLVIALVRDEESFSFGSLFVVLIGFAIFMANKRKQKSIELRKEEENSTDG